MILQKSSVVSLRKIKKNICLLTKFVADCDGFSWVRRFTNASRVAATNAERVGFPLSEIKQRKARRFYWDLGVHPLPAVCARNTLTYKKTKTKDEMGWEQLIAQGGKKGQ